LEKNKAVSKRNKINGMPFPAVLSVSVFMLFFILVLLPGCRLLFLPGAAHIENSSSAGNSNSRVWEESLSSMNITLKQFAACPASRLTASYNADRIKEAMPLGSSPESYLYLLSLFNNYSSVPEVLGLTESGAGICSAVLYSFYNNIAEQVKLFKNKAGQSETEAQKVAAAAGETVKQQEAKAGQTESNETASQQQQNQQTGSQPASPPGQAENFTASLLSLINNTRNSSGLQHLSLNSALSSIAKSRCDDMIARDYFSHVSPEGKDIKSFVDESGIIYKATGENLQYCSPPSMAGPELFFNSWMESEAHRANILDPVYTQIGVALSFNADKAIAALVFLG
jgi:uncharacterized protein YkwD